MIFEGKEHFEQLKKLYSTDKRPVYYVRKSPKSKKKELWEIVKKDATQTTPAETVNEWTFETEEAAERYLDTLIAFGYCRRK